jgi:hypothetical protein
LVSPHSQSNQIPAAAFSEPGLFPMSRLWLTAFWLLSFVADLDDSIVAAPSMLLNYVIILPECVFDHCHSAQADVQR